MSPERSLGEAIASLVGFAWMGLMVWLARRQAKRDKDSR